jgi:hypothetical protein
MGRGLRKAWAAIVAQGHRGIASRLLKMPGIRGMMITLKCPPGKYDRALCDTHAAEEDIAPHVPRVPN